MTDLIHNSHAGELLVSEFLGPKSMTPDDLATTINVDAAYLKAVIAGTEPITAELDRRLFRYLGMSAGFFLRLQAAHRELDDKRSQDAASVPFAAHLTAEATSELLRFHREGPQLLGGPFGDVDVCSNLAEALLIAARIQRDHAEPDEDLNQLTGALERYLEWEGIQA